MRYSALFALIVGALVFPFAATPEQAQDPTPLPAVAKNFRLDDHLGKSHELSRFRDAKAIVLFFAGNGCPIVRKSIPALKEIRDAYAPKGVVFLMINGNPNDDRASVAKEAQEFAVDMPVLLDSAQLVTKTLGVTRTAECLVIDMKNWSIAYRGALDDRLDYGAEKPAAGHAWLKSALDSVLAGTPVETPRTETKGCIIDMLPEPKHLSYSNNVAPILKKKCVQCHSEGEIGPFSMDSYDDIAGRKRMMREVLLTRRMPPWHADPHFGVFGNDNSLKQDELRTLVAWLDAGAPRGEGDDPLLDAPKPRLTEWPLGQPDIVLPMPQEMQIPASGVVEYQYFEVPFPGQEDIYVRAADVLPGNRQVLHHVLVFIQYPDRLAAQQPEFEGGLEGYFAGYVPGQAPVEFPKGTAKFVPAGSTFVFQVHYSPIGKPVTDLSKLGLYLYKGKQPQELLTKAAYNTDFAIPPNDAAYATTATHRILRDTLLYELAPHMHYRGKDFQYQAIYPDGSSEILLSVPKYDFNWQTLYRFKEPKLLPAGTRIVCTGAFDNSSANPSNPDPNTWVGFGEQTFEEMFIGYMGYSYVPGGNETSLPTGLGAGKLITQETLTNTEWQWGRYRIRFLEGGVMAAGERARGSWEIQDGHVLIKAGDREFKLTIKDDSLLTRDGKPLQCLS
ncbi:MAG: redoxin family protein [Candidatus Hydrogenedentes bacterium]|nr:redoxin family protein [Candidatus Hydrogenedentota bacterium]